MSSIERHKLALATSLRGCDDDCLLIDVTPEAAATGPLAAFFASQRERWGFLSNYAAAFVMLTSRSRL